VDADEPPGLDTGAGDGAGLDVPVRGQLISLRLRDARRGHCKGTWRGFLAL
jgi:hypothetical protein